MCRRVGKEDERKKRSLGGQTDSAEKRLVGRGLKDFPRKTTMFKGAKGTKSKPELTSESAWGQKGGKKKKVEGGSDI